ncbi:putative aminopeptidase NPEPL1 [Styela clava]|uniref:probable aminopeptidase NPEPL1 n=1 Tax=Styela clava TaxID=7725 RepID=UPI001939FA79|nr:probable aminopeptidase NPEPL1 [Styela clava]
MPVTKLKYVVGFGKSDPAKVPVFIVGQLRNLKQVKWSTVAPRLESKVSAASWKSAVAALHPNPTDSCSLWQNNATLASFTHLVSRHNTPSGAYHIPKLMRSCISGKAENQSIVIVCEPQDVFACGCSVARVFPTFSMRTGRNLSISNTISIEFIIISPGGESIHLDDSMAECLDDAAYSVRLSAKIVDAPCNFMHTDAFLDEIRTVGSDLGITPFIIQGKDLDEKGFGGIYGVGKASVHQPALAILSHQPEGATQTIAWCGKGIVYDTGGLSIKGKTTMPGMKRDCGGAAAILGAFRAAVKRGFKENLHAVFCLAENSVGPHSARPDDIHTLYSGRTVEINNTDAEGRLVLGDGVAYASKDLKADIILDMATLTGAQGISTGKYHGAVLSNREDWENATVKAGRTSGDLTFPLVYCPELHFSEFTSAVADMKNSVADRSNAQSSCAGLFIGSHLENGFHFKGSWIHIDMAYPVHSGERATGYGVALLLCLFGQASDDKMLQLSSPLQQSSVQATGDVMNHSAVDGEESSSKRRRLI